VHTLFSLLPSYRLHYVDDLRGQKIPFGSLIESADKIDWICNLFAVPLTEYCTRRWASISTPQKSNEPAVTAL
jgi:hypothetical protein